MKISKFSWFLFAFFFLATIFGGLLVGKWKDREVISKMYERKTFTLLDDSGSIFQLSDFPKNKKLLMIFTPDALHPVDVVPFSAFVNKMSRVQALGVDVVFVTRTNREIAKNFKLAAKFPGKILLDPSGSVGKLVGVWPDPSPIEYWSYVLTDSEFKGYWLTTTKQIFTIEEVVKNITKFSTTISNE